MAFDIVRPTLADIPAMREIVNIEVKNGVILERSEDEMANAIRSLVVKDTYRAQGLGSKLVCEAVEEGKKLGLKEILTLTYRAHLFQRLGFVIIEKSFLPNHKIWADCIKCKHFPICDEIALINKLS